MSVWPNLLKTIWVHYPEFACVDRNPLLFLRSPQTWSQIIYLPTIQYNSDFGPITGNPLQSRPQVLTLSLSFPPTAWEVQEVVPELAYSVLWAVRLLYCPMPSWPTEYGWNRVPGAWPLLRGTAFSTREPCHFDAVFSLHFRWEIQ